MHAHTSITHFYELVVECKYFPLPYSLKQSLLLDLEFAALAGLDAQRATEICWSLTASVTGVTDEYVTCGFCVHAGGLNSGPHVFTASTLAPEHPQPK